MSYSENFEGIINKFASHELTIPIFDLTSVDANAFNLIGHWQKAAKKAGWSKEDIDIVLEECRSGDYDNLVCVLLDVSTTETPDDDDEYDEDEEDEPNYGSNDYDDEDDRFIRTRYNS